MHFRYRISTLLAIKIWLLSSLGLLYAFSNILENTNTIFLPISKVYAAGQGGSSIQVWSPYFQAYGNNAGTGTVQLDKFNIVVGQDDKIGSQVSSLKAKGIKVLVYLNGSMKNTQDLGSNGNGTGTYPESSYAHTASGEQINPQAFPANRLMNPLDETWRNSLGKKCQYLINKSGYNGCLFDTIGTAPTTASYVSPGLPIDPRTNQPWQATDFLNDMVANMNLVRSMNPGALVYGNGISTGKKYYATTKPLLGGLDGGMIELFTKDPSQPPNETEADWKKNVDMLVELESQGKTALAETKGCEENQVCDPSFTTTLRNQWHKFALGTFLLGAGSQSQFFYWYEHTTTSPGEYHSWWNANIGSASGSYAKVGSIYQRNFSQGKVIVNPDPSKTYTVDLGGQYTALGSTTPISSLVLGPRSGEILAAIADNSSSTNSQDPGGGSGSGGTNSSNGGSPDSNPAEQGQANNNGLLDDKSQAETKKSNIDNLSDGFSKIARSKYAIPFAFLSSLTVVGVAWGGVILWHRRILSRPLLAGHINGNHALLPEFKDFEQTIIKKIRKYEFWSRK